MATKLSNLGKGILKNAEKSAKSAENKFNKYVIHNSTLHNIGKGVYEDTKAVVKGTGEILSTTKDTVIKTEKGVGNLAEGITKWGIPLIIGGAVLFAYVVTKKK